MLALAFVVTPVSSLHGAPPPTVTFTVNSTGDSTDGHSGDGICRTRDGVCTLRAAIQEANALAGPQNITLPASTVTLVRTGDPEDAAVNGDLDITSDVALTGGVVRGAAGWTERILDVHSGASVEISATEIRSGEGGALIRNGGFLSLQDSTVSGNHGSSGGGIFNLGTVILTDSTISNNVAETDGAGIYNSDDGSLTLDDTTVGGNTAAGDGAGIKNLGAMTLLDSAVVSNSALNYGGGIANEGAASSATITDTIVSGNSAGSDFGGGIFNYQATMTFTRGAVSGNVGKFGAGIANLAQLTVTDATISGNSASFAGGGVFSFGGLTLVGSTISANTSAGNGGGIDNHGGLIATDSTVSGNGAKGDGGGIRLDCFGQFDCLSATNVTITRNVADSDANGTGSGGGIANSTDEAVAKLANTILGGNRDNSAGSKRPDCSGPLVSRGNNLITSLTGCTITGPTGTNITGADPKLGGLRDNGGPTFTHSLATVVLRGQELDIELSPAVDRGQPCADAADQRGVSRPRDGNGNNVAACDIGAFEYDPPPFGLGTFSLAPEAAIVDVGQHLRYALAWTVPGPGWRTLDTLQLRFSNDGGVILWLQFREIAGSPGLFQLVNPKNGQVGPGFAPGSPNRLQTEAATVYLAGSLVEGPPGPVVRLTVEVSFKNRAARANDGGYEVEVLAVDDAGGRQGFVPAARIGVRPEP